MYVQILWGAEIMHKRWERDLALPNASEWLILSSSLWHRRCSFMPKLWKSALLRFCVALSNKTGYKKSFLFLWGEVKQFCLSDCCVILTALMYEAKSECRSLLTCCRRSAVSVFLGYKLKPAAKKKLSCFYSKAMPRRCPDWEIPPSRLHRWFYFKPRFYWLSYRIIQGEGGDCQAYFSDCSLSYLAEGMRDKYEEY